MRLQSLLFILVLLGTLACNKKKIEITPDARNGIKNIADGRNGMNDVSEKEYEVYMADPVHPTQAGYLEWWTPKMEEYLYQFLER